MGQLLSKVLRWQLVSAIDEGMSGCTAAARFGVVPSIAIRWHTRRREAGVASRRPKAATCVRTGWKYAKRISRRCGKPNVASRLSNFASR